MTTLQQQGYRVFLEIGPHPVLLGLGQLNLTGAEHVWLPSLRRGQEDWSLLLTSLSQLYSLGIPIDWTGFDQDYPRRRVALPTYPFERQRYWLPNTRTPSQSPSLSSPEPALLNLEGLVKLPPIGKLMQSPLLRETVFETLLSTETLPFLAEHRLGGQVVVPGAFYLSYLLSAVQLAFQTENCSLEEIMLASDGLR
jgi:acyl transferase domain-containing protein